MLLTTLLSVYPIFAPFVGGAVAFKSPFSGGDFTDFISHECYDENPGSDLGFGEACSWIPVSAGMMSKNPTICGGNVYFAREEKWISGLLKDRKN